MRTKLAVPTLLLWAENDIALGTGLLRGTDKRVETLEVVSAAAAWGASVVLP